MGTERAGCYYGIISEIERGIHRYPHRYLAQIAKALGQTVDEILEEV